MATIKQAFKSRIIEYPECYKPIYQISYKEAGEMMETEFSVNSATTSEQELQEFWEDFCKDNNLKINSIIAIACVGDESLGVHV